MSIPVIGIETFMFKAVSTLACDYDCSHAPLVVISLLMPKAKLVRLTRPMRFDEAMRRLVALPSPPTGKKAKRKKRKKPKR